MTELKPSLRVWYTISLCSLKTVFLGFTGRIKKLEICRNSRKITTTLKD